MLDIKFIRENKDVIKSGAEKKHMSFDVDFLITLDDRRLELLSAVEGFRSEQNAVLVAYHQVLLKNRHQRTYAFFLPQI